MNKLADIIINRLKKLQEELDNEFFGKIGELQSDWEVTTTEPLNEITFSNAKYVLLEQLNDQLKEALTEENYKLAQLLKEKIAKLNDKLD